MSDDTPTTTTDDEHMGLTEEYPGYTPGEYAEAVEAVVAGAAALDSYAATIAHSSPGILGWRGLVDVKTLDLYFVRLCVLGQVARSAVSDDASWGSFPQSVRHLAAFNPLCSDLVPGAIKAAWSEYLTDMRH